MGENDDAVQDRERTGFLPLAACIAAPIAIWFVVGVARRAATGGRFSGVAFDATGAIVFAAALVFGWMNWGRDRPWADFRHGWLNWLLMAIYLGGFLAALTNLIEELAE
jgi:hypothetical protein